MSEKVVVAGRARRGIVAQGAACELVDEAMVRISRDVITRFAAT